MVGAVPATSTTGKIEVLDQAKEYLARVVPWPDPGQQAFINIHWTFEPKTPTKDGKPPWTGRACASMEEAVRALTFAMKSADTKDIYVCMSSQASYIERRSRKNFTYKQAVRSQENAVTLKSFYIDIDVKEGPKGYGTVDECVEALAKFIKDSGMPKPSIVVHSGGGFHVYWVVSRALTPDEWRPYAIGLAEATKHYGLKCDTGCTIDSARILRIPDTFNRKQSTPRHVAIVGPRTDFDYAFERVVAPLEKFKGRTSSTVHGIDLALFPRRAPLPAGGELGANLDNLFPTVDLDGVLPACAFLASAVLNGGVDLDNPLWNLTTLISTFTKGGRADAHRMGNKHAGYTKESTDDFFDRKTRERDEKGLGWPSCSTISASGAKACATCPLMAQGKSPLNFEQRTPPTPAGPSNSGSPSSNGGVQGAHAQGGGQQNGAQGVAPVVSTIAGFTVQPSQVGTQAPDMPPGYSRDQRGIVSRLIIDPGGTGITSLQPVSDYPMMNAWIEKRSNSEFVLHYDSIVERAKVTQIDLPLEVIASNEMRKYLQSQGFMLAQSDKSSGDFFVSWVKQLQKAKDAVTSAPFGWSEKNGKTEGFIYAGQLWTPHGTTPSASADGMVARHYRPTGGDNEWIEAAKLVTGQGRPDLEALLASAFAAPLVRFTGHNGMLMSAYSKESGIGKSTALRIAQAVWGDPIKAIQSLSDTQNSVMAKIGEVRSLPIYWDELKTDEDTKKFVNITFQIGQGKEKSRLTQQAKQREAGSWQTLVVSASNDSILDHVMQQTSTTLAGLYRIFEYKVAPPMPGAAGTIDTARATIILSRLNTNYGQVGLKYANFLGTHFKQIETDIEAVASQLEKETSAAPDERFWIGLMSTILLGARYANHLGYAVFDEVGLRAFMLKCLSGMRGVRSQQTVDLTQTLNLSDILSGFVAENRGQHMLITDRIHVVQGKPPKFGSVHGIKIANDINQLSRISGLYLQYGQTDKLLRISSQAFGEYLKKKNKSRHLVVEALKEKGVLRMVNGMLGGGTPYSQPAAHLYEIDLTAAPDLDFMDV